MDTSMWEQEGDESAGRRKRKRRGLADLAGEVMR
jgi:hypothetical protein